MPLLPGEEVEDDFGGEDDFVEAPAQKAPTPAAVDEEEEDEEDDEEGEYEVEKILEHGWLDNGKMSMRVKWKGYSLKDATWEPEENMRADAPEAVAEYLIPFGGKIRKDQLKPDKKRKAESSTPVGSMRGRKKNKSEEPDNDDIPSGKTKFQPPKGSWDNDINSIDAIEEESDPKTGETVRFGFVIWNKQNTRSKHPLLQLHEKCPKKMLNYYYQHLLFKYTGPSEDWPKAENGTSEEE